MHFFKDKAYPNNCRQPQSLVNLSVQLYTLRLALATSNQLQIQLALALAFCEQFMVQSIHKTVHICQNIFCQNCLHFAIQTIAVGVYQLILEQLLNVLGQNHRARLIPRQRRAIMNRSVIVIFVKPCIFSIFCVESFENNRLVILHPQSLLIVPQ